MTTCHCCNKQEAEYTVWSAFWINAADGVIYTCKDCVKCFKKLSYNIYGKEAKEKFEAIKLFVRYPDNQFECLKSTLLEKGDIIRGHSCPITLGSIVGIKYNNDYWLVMLYSLINCGDDTYWIKQIDERK